jgi:hypothetical protein
MLLRYINDTDWQLQLISLYNWIDEGFEQRGWKYIAQRFSRNGEPIFDDALALTSYIFARLNGHHVAKKAWRFIHAYLSQWFPHLPKYSAWLDRLHRLNAVMVAALEELTFALTSKSEHIFMMDSCPLVMAKARRSNNAKVAKDLAAKGYCASKSMYYYGVKLHVIAQRKKGCLPRPVAIGISPANLFDGKAFEAAMPMFTEGCLVADKAYDSRSNKAQMKEQGSELKTPYKRTKGHFHWNSSDTQSKDVSRERQPIESLFAWLNEQTGIQDAHRPRSSKGLLTFIWSSLLTALLLLLSR